MFTTLLTATLLSAAAIRGARADFTIDTPASLVQCQAQQITWSQTTGPYNLIVVSAADPCGDDLVDLGDHDGLSMTWTVNVAAGTEVLLALEDETGEEAWTGAVTVAASDDSSCLSSSSSSSSIAASSSSSAVVASSSVKASSVAASSSVKASSTKTATSATSTVTDAAEAAGAGTTGALSGASVVRPAMALGALGFAVAAFLC
ncbi:uncharacterized protein STEHIDRAFT_152753 [Stereum hirsutum FP-91666 SS1]|uniref:uncharacterized protein n=1 Tax=Stereum hirsutum (strain FP-91666) TaxID=721885 RepID=UPI000440F2A6|nr:uncharacterized protein STEHIDRAFT_152753 [Stereum hirsutum FP-91666 SS1]EIM91078.1 hypothetical protein STEHIDRAFT_152753 [Stereum hirsutum FP-91666 SS1]